MRSVIAVILLALTTGAAAAQSRPSTLTMSCGQAQGLVQSRGAIVLSTGRHTFDRFVADGRFCQIDEFADLFWVATADTAECPIGYVCRSRRLVEPDFD